MIEFNWNKDDDITPVVSVKGEVSQASRVADAEKRDARSIRVRDVATSIRPEVKRKITSPV